LSVAKLPEAKLKFISGNLKPNRELNLEIEEKKKTKRQISMD
jgi:hypothetical protein